MTQAEWDVLWADRLRASYEDWAVLWDFCEGIKTMKIVLSLPITEKRPEEIRVSHVGAWFLVETKRPGGQWITQKEHRNEDEAKRDAETWY